jgi:hypothetical protein
MKRVMKHAIKKKYDARSLRELQYVKVTLDMMGMMFPPDVHESLVSYYNDKEAAFINGTAVSWDDLEPLEEGEEEQLESFVTTQLLKMQTGF